MSTPIDVSLGPDSLKHYWNDSIASHDIRVRFTADSMRNWADSKGVTKAYENYALNVGTSQLYWYDSRSWGDTSVIVAPHYPVVAPVDSVYAVRTGLVSGPSAGDLAIKRLKSDLSEELHYGVRGVRVDELQCPHNITADYTYVWIDDGSNHRIMQRRAADYGYVQQIATYYGAGVHTREGYDVFWTSHGSYIDERNKSDLSVARSSAWPPTDYRGELLSAYDITDDGVNLYIAVGGDYRVVCFDRANLEYQSEFGTYPDWELGGFGITSDGTYLYVCDYRAGKILKVDPTDYSIIASVGHISLYYGKADVYYYGGKIYCADENSAIRIYDTNLNELAVITNVNLLYPSYITVDSNYIYVLENGFEYVHRFNTTTYEYVDTTSIGLDYFGYGLTSDDNYLYILDQETPGVHVWDKLTMTYVTSWTDLDWDILSNPQCLSNDDNYIYISDEDRIHRISKQSLDYVDTKILSDTTIALGAYPTSTGIYVNDYYGGVQQYSLSDWTLVDKAPATNGDPNYWLTGLYGITCDSSHIYVTVSTGGAPFYTNGEIRIYTKDTYTYVATIDLDDTCRAWYLSVDAEHLFVPVSYSDNTGNILKFLKTAPYTLVASSDDFLGQGCEVLYLFTGSSFSDNFNNWSDSLNFILDAPGRATLLYSTGLMEGRNGWFYDRYNPNVRVHYGEEGENIHSILLGGENGGVYQLMGPNDNGEPIRCNIRTMSRDQGDLRYNKLYGDVMLDCDTQSADVTATIGFDNHTILSPAVTVNQANRTQVPIPVGSEWQTAKNISLDLTWNHNGADPEYFYMWEPRYTEEGGKLTAYTWQTSYITHGIEEYFFHGYLYLVHISTADLTFSIIAEDGTTAASITVTASGGLHHKDFLRLPVVKGKIFKYKLSSATQFRVEGQESELLIKQWGSESGWHHARIFQDMPTGEAA